MLVVDSWGTAKRSVVRISVCLCCAVSGPTEGGAGPEPGLWECTCSPFAHHGFCPPIWWGPREQQKPQLSCRVQLPGVLTGPRKASSPLPRPPCLSASGLGAP